MSSAPRRNKPGRRQREALRNGAAPAPGSLNQQAFAQRLDSHYRPDRSRAREGSQSPLPRRHEPSRYDERRRSPGSHRREPSRYDRRSRSPSPRGHGSSRYDRKSRSPEPRRREHSRYGERRRSPSVRQLTSSRYDRMRSRSPREDISSRYGRLARSPSPPQHASSMLNRPGIEDARRLSPPRLAPLGSFSGGHSPSPTSPEEAIRARQQALLSRRPEDQQPGEDIHQWGVRRIMEAVFARDDRLEKEKVRLQGTTTPSNGDASGRLS